MTAFRIGDQVVIEQRPESRHHRVPAYIKGKSGEVAEICSDARLPEEISEHLESTTRVPVYRIRVPQSDIWPDYAGNQSDTLEIEIYEHWLVKS